MEDRSQHSIRVRTTWIATLSAVMLACIALTTRATTASSRPSIHSVKVDRVVTGHVSGPQTRFENAGAVDFLGRLLGFLVAYKICGTSNFRGTSNCGFRLLRTRDGGKTWTVVHRGLDLAVLTFVSDRDGYAVDAQGRLRVTHDGGRRWAVVERQFAHLETVDFVNRRDGWLLGRSIYRTLDGGQSWRKLPFNACSAETQGYSGQAFTRLSFVNASTGFVWCRTGGGPFFLILYRTRNAGQSWSQVSRIGNVHAAGPMQFLSPKTGFVSAGFGDLLETHDGGLTFHVVSNTPFEDVLSISWQSPRAGYVNGYGMLMHTADGGKHWAQVYPRPTPIGPIALDAAGSGVGADTPWFASALLRTHNGQTWDFVRRLLPGAGLGATVGQLVRKGTPACGPSPPPYAGRISGSTYSDRATEAAVGSGC